MTEALQTIIGELKTLSPDITNACIFRQNGEALASSKNTMPEQIENLITGLNSITQTECIGGIESLTIQDSVTQLSITAVEDVYLATVSSRSADQKTVKSLTQVVVPTVIRLVCRATSLPVEKLEPLHETARRTAKTVLLPKKEAEVKSIPEPQTPLKPLLPKASSTQFLVEKIGGLLVAGDTVRIDFEVIGKWQEQYGNKQFTRVTVETLEGKTVVCKYKPRRGIKGIIQIPEKILQTLQTSRGKLVMARPADN